MVEKWCNLNAFFKLTYLIVIVLLVKLYYEKRQIEEELILSNAINAFVNAEYNAKSSKYIENTLILSSDN